jgi:signal peptidase II
VFNVGDAAISIAVVILLLRAFLSPKDQAKGHDPKETIEHA